jgi:hypothetical protein
MVSVLYSHVVVLSHFSFLDVGCIPTVSEQRIRVQDKSQYSEESVIAQRGHLAKAIALAY